MFVSNTLFLSLISLCLDSLLVDAAPSNVPRGQTVSLSHTQSSIDRVKRQSIEGRSIEERDSSKTWLLNAATFVDTRYNSGNGGFTELLASIKPNRKRGNGDVDLADHSLDASYSGSVSIGTPAQSFPIVLDTGSSDLWIAGSDCTLGCNGMQEFDSSSSSTFKSMNGNFSISYGSGQATGKLVQDVVTLGGYSVDQQIFASCTALSPGLISTAISGIMGLSWQALAYSKATPWWVTMAKSGQWSQPLFGFYLKRYRDVAGASANEADGGTATFGYLDSSKISGDVTYVDVPNNAQYWQIPIGSLSVQGQSIDIGSSNQAAIDTGTTLIGGPSDVIDKIYAAIPGATKMAGSYSSYYQYPCNTSVDFELTFGGYTIHVSDADFNLGKYSSDETMCTGAAFVQVLPKGAPVQWIVGDTALKNTYSVYRYNPPAMGFADLADGLSDTQSSSTTIPVMSTLAADANLNASSTASASMSTSKSSKSSSSATQDLPNGANLVTITKTSASASATAVAANTSGSASRQGEISAATILVSLGLSWLVL